MKEAKGTVQAISPKPNKDYMGVNVETEEGEEWFNGNDEDVPSMSKGDLIKIQHNDGWIKEIDVMEQREEQSQMDGGASKRAQNKGDNSQSSNTFQTQKSRDITVKVATKLAVEHASTRPENQGEHLNEVNELASGYISIMEGLAKEINGDQQ